MTLGFARQSGCTEVVYTYNWGEDYEGSFGYGVRPILSSVPRNFIVSATKPDASSKAASFSIHPAGNEATTYLKLNPKRKAHLFDRSWNGVATLYDRGMMIGQELLQC